MSSSAGTASTTSAGDGRLSTSPIAPSSPCSATSTTVRWKLGSTSVADAISRWPRSDSMAGSTAAVHGDRQPIEEDLVHLGQLALEPLEHEPGAGRRREQSRLDLGDRLEPHELLLERLREAAAAEVPAV